MFKILVAGDYCPGDDISNMIEGGNFSFFDEVKPFTDCVDYSIVNFESPVVKDTKTFPIEKNGPCLRCSPGAVRAIKYAGFNGVTLANNHFFDYGEVGVKDTISTCKEYGIDYVGGGTDLQEAQRCLIKEIKGERVAIINFCENEFSIASSEKGGSAPLNPIQNYYQIKKMRQNADYVLIIIHGGTEGYQLPTPRMKETYRFFIDAGADAVINHHQHCYSGFEVYQGKFIFYGLGNFLFPHLSGNKLSSWEEGYMVEISFGDKMEFRIIPYTQCRNGFKVSIMKNADKFFTELNELNDVIENTSQLEEKFLTLTQKVHRDIVLEPIQWRYIKSMQLRNWIPSLLSHKQMMCIMNYICCESHLDILRYNLKKRLYNGK